MRSRSTAYGMWRCLRRPSASGAPSAKHAWNEHRLPADAGKTRKHLTASAPSTRARNMPTPRTMFEKIWSRHVIAEEEGELLLYIDRAYIHEGSSHAFAALDARDRRVARPRQVFAHADHYVPTGSRKGGVEAIASPEIRNMGKVFQANTGK